MKHLKNVLILLTCGFWTFGIWAQENTVGTIIYNPDLYEEGLTFICPHNQTNAMLLNACGEVVHQWDLGEGMRPGNVGYLLENGDLMMTSRNASVGSDAIWAGGGGANISRRSWANEVLWSYTLNDSTARLHHDIEVMPNGNVLAICWESIDSLSAVAAGRNPELLSAGVLWSDKVIELQPDGNGGAEVVWEWRAWDHLVQDFDSTKANYGIVADEQQRINVNFGSIGNTPQDWLHINSIDFYPYYDSAGQILLSIPTFDEIWVIWHDFSLEEELIWRWGNPQAYNRGDSTDQQLFFQHDAHWGQSDMAIEPGNSDFTKICLFNNRVPSDSTVHSEVAMLTVGFDEYEGGYEFDEETGVWGPDDFSWTYTEEGLNSSGLSSFQLLGDGSYLICSGRTGELLENTSDGTRAWEYRTPLMGGEPVEQGTELAMNQNLTFRAYRYPSDYTAFDGIEWSGGAPIEINPTPVEACAVGVDESFLAHWQVYPNPMNDVLEWTLPNSEEGWTVQLHNVTGQALLSATLAPGTETGVLDVSDLPHGFYVLSLNNSKGTWTQKLIKN